MNAEDLVKFLHLATIASCHCTIKTDDAKYHRADCRYRLLTEAVDTISRQSATIKALTEALAGYMSAADQFNEAMRDGINVHGALSALCGYAEMAEHALAHAREEE